jgi:probable HAF family extracellular repeat protein
MNPRTARSIWFALATLVFTAAVQARYDYTVSDLTPLNVNARSLAVNDTGQVVGYMTRSVAGSLHQRAFLYSAGKMTDLGDLGGGTAVAYGINNAGQIVGTATTPSGAMHAFLYYAGTMIDITPDAETAAAYDINNAGQVVGFFSSFYGQTHTFLYSAGVLADLGIFGFVSSYATGINDLGQIVGYMSNGLGNANQHAFLYSDGSMTDLGAFGATGATAYRINNAGQIAVIAFTATSSAIYSHAFLYSGGLTTNLTLGGQYYGYALSINNAGQVVGQAQTKDGVLVPFLYSGRAMFNLATLVDMSSSSLASLYEATGISNTGLIVGSGYTIDGQRHAFLLTPISENPNVPVIFIPRTTVLGAEHVPDGAGITLPFIFCIGMMVFIRQCWWARGES